MNSATHLSSIVGGTMIWKITMSVESIYVYDMEGHKPKYVRM